MPHVRVPGYILVRSHTATRMTNTGSGGYGQVCVGVVSSQSVKSTGVGSHQRGYDGGKKVRKGKGRKL
jgi:hypothetical protein